MIGSILTASGRAEARALSEAMASLRAAPDGLDQLAPQLEMLTAHCRTYPEETRRLWKWFEDQQPCAMLDDLREVFEGHLALLDERIRLVKEVQSLAAELNGRAATPPDEATLDQVVGDLAAQRSCIAGMWDRMNGPMPPWSEPPRTRAERRAAFERGEYETIESIIARVQAGGPVSKD